MLTFNVFFIQMIRLCSISYYTVKYDAQYLHQNFILSFILSRSFLFSKAEPMKRMKNKKTHSPCHLNKLKYSYLILPTDKGFFVLSLEGTFKLPRN